MASIEIALKEIGMDVWQDESGNAVVPLKPLSDAFGLQWKEQWERANRPHMARLFGTCLVKGVSGGQVRLVTCIRVDRVVAWVFRVNPESVRAGGNEIGADFLLEKDEELSDAIHRHESRAGGMIQRTEGEGRPSVKILLPVSSRDVKPE